MRALRILSLAWPLTLLGCGSANPAAPTASPELPGATSVTIVSGETGQPVAGASVTAAGQVLTTSASGQVKAASGLPLTIDASGFLRRETLPRPGDATLTLWPVRPEAGEDFVGEIVYHQLFSDGSLVRPTSGVTLMLSTELAADAAARATITRAAASVSAASGTIPFSVSDGPASGVAFSIRVDPADPILRGNQSYVAFTRVETQGHRVTGGSIVLRARASASNLGLVTHEIGHAFGLGHTSQPGLMTPVIGAASDFSAAEKLVLRMMLQRAPGNRAPDNDTGVASASGREARLLACEGD